MRKATRLDALPKRSGVVWEVQDDVLSHPREAALHGH